MSLKTDILFALSLLCGPAWLATNLSVAEPHQIQDQDRFTRTESRDRLLIVDDDGRLD